MNYYVCFDPNTGTLFALSTIMFGGNMPDGFVIEEREGNLPPHLDLWVPEQRVFKDALDENLKLTKLQFINRMTMAERIAIEEARKTNPIINDIYNQLEFAEFIELNHPDIINGVYYIASVGIIPLARAQEILSPN